MGWGSGAPFKLRPGPCFGYAVGAPLPLGRLWACIVGSLFSWMPSLYVCCGLSPATFFLFWLLHGLWTHITVFSSVLSGPVLFCSWMDLGAGSLLALLGSADGACCRLQALPHDELLRTDVANRGLKVLAAVYLWLGCSQEVKGLAKSPCCPVFVHCQSSINACKVRVSCFMRWWVEAFVPLLLSVKSIFQTHFLGSVEASRSDKTWWRDEEQFLSPAPSFFS